MFAEAALNTLAEAVVTSWGRVFNDPFGFERLRKLISEPNPGEPIRSFLKFQPTMRRLRAAVTIPRSVMSVHPTGRLSGGMYSYGPAGHIRIITAELWPDTGREKRDSERLRKALEQDVPVPDDLEIGRSLVDWAMRTVPEQLSDSSLKEVRPYVLRNGCSASPFEALEETIGFLADVAAHFGQPLRQQGRLKTCPVC